MRTELGDPQSTKRQPWPSASLIASAQQGDEASLGILVSAAHPHVNRFAHVLCATPQDAEDAAQEALIILYRKVGALRAASAIGSWMFQIVRRECLRRSHLLIRPVRFPPADSSRSPEDIVVEQLEADRVARAISALPEVQRRVLVRRDVLGHAGRDVADELGLSLPAMKSQLHRARLSLRDDLERND